MIILEACWRWHLPTATQPAPNHRPNRSAELEALKEQLSTAASGSAGDLEEARQRCAAAEAARGEAEEQWRAAFEELMRTKRDLEDTKWAGGLVLLGLLWLAACVCGPSSFFSLLCVSIPGDTRCARSKGWPPSA
jgi:hypothetical protein